MKFVLLFVFVFVCVAYARPEEQYTSKFDNINIDGILKSERLLQNYCDCLLSKKKCTPDGEELKKILPDALKTHCSKCNDKQKDAARKVLRFLIKKEGSCFTDLEHTYDPQGTYRKEYEKELKEEGL